MTEAQSQPDGTPESTTSCFVGVDVAKAWLDVGVRPSGAHWRVANAEAELPALVARLRTLAPQLVVLEATGGYERAVVAALGAAGLPVVVLNPRQVRDFAKATGRLAKTDQLDAQALAHFAEAVHPEPRPLSDEATQQLAALLERRAQVVGMLTAEKNRHSQAVARVRSLRRTSPGWKRRWTNSTTTSIRRCTSVRSGVSVTTCCAASPASVRFSPSPSWPICPSWAGWHISSWLLWSASPRSIATAGPRAANA